MKFIYINNSQCTDCGRCSEECPTGAIYIYDEKRYVNYDKCTSCGTCLKSCGYDAVWFESAQQLVRRSEKSEQYRARIRRLETETALLRGRLDSAEQNLSTAVSALPLAAFVAGKDGLIQFANAEAVRLAGIDELRLADMPENLAGENIVNIFPYELREVMRFSGEADGKSVLAKAGDIQVTVEIHPLTGEAFLCMISDMRDKTLASAHLLGLLRESIERKMEAVRKIGALLGDEASAEINDLNTAISIVEDGLKENKNSF